MNKKEATSAKVAQARKSDSFLLYRSAEDEARNLFHPFKTLLRHHRVRPAILYGRVSSREQATHGNLQNQIDSLRTHAARSRVRVLATCTDEKPGWRMGRPGLLKAFRLARETGAYVLAEGVDRFLRPKGYNPKDKSTWTRPDYERFGRIAHGVTCVTWKHPAATDGEQQSAHIKRGQEQKGHKGGRPVKLSQAEWRDLMRPQVIQSKKQGFGYCEIAKALGMSSQTVWRWCRDSQKTPI